MPRFVRLKRGFCAEKLHNQAHPIDSSQTFHEEIVSEKMEN
jgi:hypothetical protein